MSAKLEYDEEDDLFVEDGQYNAALPISGPSDYAPPFIPAVGASTAGGLHSQAGPSRPRATDDRHSSRTAIDAQNAATPTYPRLVAPQPTQRTALVDGTGQEIVVDWRYTAELKAERDKGKEAYPDKGVMSLKGICIGICRGMYSEMRDIGSVPYALARDFLTLMLMEQLAEVEDNSPELRKDTDWLWELFLRDHYPQFHASALIKKGVKRTSGWRRMYKLAVQEARERQANAEIRLAERYKELEEEKERKKVKVLDRAPVGKMRKLGGGGVYAPTKSTPTIKSSGMFGKYRAESQRVNLALKRNASSRINAFSHPHQAPAPSSAQTSLPAASASSRSASSTGHVAHPSRMAYRPPAGSRAPKPYRAPPLHVRQQEMDKVRAALPSHLVRATAENVAATKAGRSMGITDAAFTPTHDGKVSVKPASTPISPVTPIAAGAPTKTSLPTVGSSTRAPVGNATASSSYRPRRMASTSTTASQPTTGSPARLAPRVTALDVLRTPPSAPRISTTSSVPAKRPASAMAGEVIDVDSLPQSSSASRPALSAAAIGQQVTRPPNFNQNQLESVLFRKRPRPGTSNLQKSR